MPRFRSRESLNAVGRQREPDTGMLDARPRQARANPIAAVPVDGSGMYARENPLRALLVGRINAGGQAILVVVHLADGCVVVRNCLDADDRAEAFLAHDLHRMVDIDQHRRREPVAFPLERSAAEQQLRAFLFRIGDLPPQHGELGASRARAYVSALVEWIAG